jgi:diguanylate cyclase (GGDEF)-like protein
VGIRQIRLRLISLLLLGLAVAGVCGIAIGAIQLRQAISHSAARADRALVDRALDYSAAGLTFLAVGTFIIAAALFRASRSCAAAAQTLRTTNAALEKVQDLDRRGVSILEMVGRHAPLSQSLGAVAELAGALLPGAGAAIWSATANTLLYQVGADLPEALTSDLRLLSFELADGRLILGPLPLAEGLDCASFPLQNIAGDSIGLLLIFSSQSSAGPPPSLSSQMAQLASLAVENILLYDRLAFQAQHDVLTGLPNRLLFQDRVRQAILLAQRNAKKLAVLWIDVDRFKRINDTLGHRVGDELLCEVARRLGSSMRESDTAARIGGDEFVVLVTDMSGSADPAVVPEKIMKTLRMPMTISGRELRITVSVGIGIFPEHGSEPAVLMRNADLAMYQAKRAGRDGYQTFLPQFSVSLGRRLQLEQELKSALAAGEFHLEYQPLIGRRDQLAGFEALLRWRNPKLGNVSPAEFIPIAEEAGEILQIGEWVARTACRQGARWIESGFDVPSISVNASGLQFAERDFTKMICSALDDSGFPASKLEIEVTETALVQNIERALGHIKRLRALGIKFAIDDFGTGYSSLSQLRTLPVDSVKVDRSFIKDLQDAPTDTTTLVRGIIHLAHNLELRVVGEGVETQKQLSLLRSMGCDVSQGFFLYRPMDAVAAENLMKGFAGVEEVLVGPRPGGAWLSGSPPVFQRPLRAPGQPEFK